MLKKSSNFIILFIFGKNLDYMVMYWITFQILIFHFSYLTYSTIFYTATIVLQSERLSSSAKFDYSLFTTTTFSTSAIPPRSKSSEQSIEPNIQWKIWKQHLAAVPTTILLDLMMFLIWNVHTKSFKSHSMHNLQLKLWFYFAIDILLHCDNYNVHRAYGFWYAKPIWTPQYNSTIETNYTIYACIEWKLSNYHAIAIWK